ncbi:MAG: hypothetical protein ACT4P6_11965, partial [Gemmatimonadaceae bacterium]
MNLKEFQSPPLGDSIASPEAALATPRVPTDPWAIGSPREPDARQRAFEAALVASVFPSDARRDRA